MAVFQRHDPGNGRAAISRIHLERKNSPAERRKKRLWRLEVICGLCLYSVVFLDVKPLHQKPPRNPAWIAAVILIGLSLGVLAFFKLRATKTATGPVQVEEIREEPFPPVATDAPAGVQATEETATFSLSPVVSPEDASAGSVISPGARTNRNTTGGPPRIDLPTMRSSAASSMTDAPADTPPPPAAASTPPPTVVSTVMSAPRVPGLLTARMSGEGAASAPRLASAISPPSGAPVSPSASRSDSSPADASARSAVSAATLETARSAVSLPRRPVRDAFEAQLALDQQGISAGSIDGVYGNQTRLALLAFQQKARISMTGQIDEQTKSRLSIAGESYRHHVVTDSELNSLAPVPDSWTERSKRPHLGFESILELVTEKSHASPAFIRRLNPGFDWNSVAAGSRIRVPNSVRETPRERAAFLRIRLAERTVQAFDQDNRLIAHFPCSIAANFANRPQGELKVTVLVEGPNYTFDPKRFPNTPEARFMVTKLILPPGPNNPVGAAWIGLDSPGYGIHGTPDPEKIGKTGSLGCFRLANWNAQHLIKMSWVGMPVFVVK